MVAYIALGSNLGDRAANLALARERIDAVPGCRVLAASQVEETAPIGPADQPHYLNQMLAVQTNLPPIDLLDRLLAIESEAGRVRMERWGARTLDLDIVRYGAAVLDHPRLTVPHPELPRRDFWQRELRELEHAAGSVHADAAAVQGRAPEHDRDA